MHVKANLPVRTLGAVLDKKTSKDLSHQQQHVANSLEVCVGENLPGTSESRTEEGDEEKEKEEENEEEKEEIQDDVMGNKFKALFKHRSSSTAHLELYSGA